MKNQSKNGGTPSGTIPCYPVMGSVTTMDKKRIYKIINYVAMSDGGVYPNSTGKKHRFIMNMLEEHEDFISWISTVLENLTTVRITKRVIKDDGFVRKPQLRLESKNHPYFSKVRHNIYVDKYKGLSSHYLKMMDTESLAILYMCDGCLHTEVPSPKRRLVNPSYSVSLNLKRLSEGDTLMLKKAIKSTFNLEFNIKRQKQYYYLTLGAKQVDNFMKIIIPHMFPSFEYKLVRTIDPTIVGDDIVCSQ